MEIADKEKESVSGSNEEADEDDLSDVEEGETKLFSKFKYQVGLSRSIRKVWATLAAIFNVFKRCQKEDVDQYQKVPLEEEWKLYGLDSMSLFHAPIDFESVPAPSHTNFDLSTLSDVFWVAGVSALSDFTHLIKKVIKSRKLIVVVPDIVISEIDPLKRESASVRECIRWLETCFRTGNRFIRAQRQNEHQVIPLY
ncbi:hypothetical protein DAPPUDRAFT_264714 [Daphnia pulex]|uniref:PIN domain-containing protein n=1 Tax=Daphnia pulex TaxID=6669 RepID=E9HS54_DAPPU|nr:hypothetical protein DAPPUDRAFT_264714 [Daphnia pulex]|eukprot:EFX65429.1 hypothetical protein DAPPUDRAFT_264714 [Daphnia pulex]